MHTVYLSLGSNLGDRKKNLCDACQLLQESAGSLVLRSSLYETEPWGFEHENLFYNQVVSLHTKWDAFELLVRTQAIEKKMGRIRDKIQYAARTIDIDILLYGDCIIGTDSLKIPHPFMEKRFFVLMPLAEIAPFLLHPVLKMNMQQLLAICPDQKSVKKIPDPSR